MSNETRKELAFLRSQFMVDINQKSGNASLRAIEVKTGISASTLSRIQNGHDMDMTTFMTICSKLGLEPSSYFIWEVWERVTTHDTFHE